MNTRKLLFGFSLLALVVLLLYVTPSYAASPITIDMLTADETAGLLYMLEEEKLAHDVYVALYDKWGLPVFDNISASETRHQEAIKTLLERYELPDPTSGHAAGQFTDQTSQQLYDKLVNEGSLSLANALRAGATIEEIDIQDLQQRITQTTRTDIEEVYENLTKGSENHLRAFTSNLLRHVGEEYQPQYLDPKEYDEIINAPVQRGGGRGHGRR